MTRAELRQHVIAREGQCILAILDPTHECFDRWGMYHTPTDLDKLTLEHVREHPGGMRRDEPGWCVAMCFRGNDQHVGTRKEYRPLILAYLEGVRREAAR